MAQVIGYLREDRATKGEKRVHRALANALPKDFYVYVECPLHDKNIERMPDFIVVTTFGVVILEVKDWVEILRADKFHAWVRTKAGEDRQYRNPVRIARRFAEILADKLEKVPSLLGEKRHLKIPWGYAVVLSNQPPSVISQLRTRWGEVYVLGMKDLRPPIVTQRLKATLPFDYDLRRDDIRYVRAVINSPVYIKRESGKPDIVLDAEQEKLVVESPHIQEERPAEPLTVSAKQQELFPSVKVETQGVSPIAEGQPDAVEALMRNFSIRLVRGVAGSGKTLVLTQRVKYLSSLYPEWQIAVFTYNTPLAESLQASLKGFSNVQVTNFHKKCNVLLKDCIKLGALQDPEGWLNHNVGRWSVVRELGVDFVDAEIRWIKDIGIPSREAYLKVMRKGRGKGLAKERREQIYDVLEDYTAQLAQNNAYDWGDVPNLVLKYIEEGKIVPGIYDAIFIDEAQDFAPSWIQVVRRLLKPDSGLIFMADDPSQSIYRYFSWREKGIPVVGRTRWLRVPYRNTKEIYQAAYEVIRGDEVLKQDLAEELGMDLDPDLNSKYLRSGPPPQLREFSSPSHELAFIRSEVEWLMQNGFDAREIAVLHRRKSGIDKLKSALRGLGVGISTFHASKGLEFEVVFLSQMQYTFSGKLGHSKYALSEERRLVYMAMTRARERLYMSYEGNWPASLKDVCQYVD